MTTRIFSFKSQIKLLTWSIFLTSFIFSSLNAQCPTVSNNAQSFCDVESILVGDLVAINNGGGIVWYESSTSTTPLLNIEGLIDGEDYYADDNTGSCGVRQRVDVTILGAPTGQNFQGVCLDDTSIATIADLVAVGNNVQWYISPSSNIPLSDSTVLIDDAIYYADQENPDSGCRTSRLQVQVNVGFTPVPIGDAIQEFCNSPSSIPTVSDLSASGTNNWYISLFSALPLDPLFPLVDGQIYYASTTDPPCESDGRLAVLALLTDSPDPGIDSTLELCENDSSIDLFTALEGTPDSGGTWSPALNSGTGLFDPSIDLADTYTYTVVGTPPCDDTSAIVIVTVAPIPDAGENGSVEVCSNGDILFLFDFLQGTPEPGGTWSPALTSGTDEFNPAVDPAIVYTYTVAGIPPCDDATATVTVTIPPEPDAGENGAIEVCGNGDIIFLFDFLQGTPQPGGTWSPALASGTDEFNPASDPEDIYTYTVAGIPPCEDATATVAVTIIQSVADAGENGSVEVCSDGDILFLFDILQGTPQPGGTWSPALASGTDEFNPAIDSADIYTYTVANVPPCEDATATVEVIITPESDAGENGSVEVCSNSDIIFLFDFLQGTPQPSGVWSPALASGTDEFNPAVDSANIYTYTVAGIPPCEDDFATVTVIITPETDAGENGSVEVCDNGDVISLFDFLQGTPQLGGTWSPALSSGTDEFNPVIDSANVYTYTVAGIPPCEDDSATITVTFTPAPDAGENGSVEVCSNGDNLFLFDFLQGTPQTGGTWSPVLASGTDEFNPAVDPAVVYTYTVAGIAPCEDSASVAVTLIPEADAGENGSVEVCSNSAVIFLFDFLQGIPQAGGTWSPALSSGTDEFNPAIDAANTYTYTVAGISPCDEDSATVTVTNVPEADAGENGSVEVCVNGDIIFLFNFLQGTPQLGGTWSPSLVSGTDEFDPAVDSADTYTYSVAGTLPCEDDSATVEVILTTEPDAGEDGIAEVCNTGGVVFLFDFLQGAPQAGGTWSPLLASGTDEFDPAVDPEDTYTYTVGGIPPCDVDSATVLVTIVTSIADAGEDGFAEVCSNSNNIFLFDFLQGTPQAGGTWSPELASGTDEFDPAIDSADVYTYSVTDITPCDDDTATVTVTIIPEPDAGENGVVDICDTGDNIFLFDVLQGTPQAGGTWSPALASNTDEFNPSVDLADTYTYTVAGVPPCGEDSATVIVTIIPGPDAGENGFVEICSNADVIRLFDFLQGNPQPGGIWSPALASGTDEFNPAVDAANTFTYTVAGLPPCEEVSATVSVTITPDPDAGVDSAVAICSDDDITDLFDFLGPTADSGGTWFPALTSGTGLFDPSIDPEDTYTYTVSSSACNLRDVSTITVSINEKPDITGAVLDSDASICIGLDLLIEISGATALIDGNYTIDYLIAGANDETNTIDIIISGGSSSFIIPSDLIPNSGISILTITGFYFVGEFCSGDTDLIAAIEIDILETETPQISDQGNQFCEQDNPTISDLSNNILNSEPITWYDLPENGVAFSESDPLEDGATYYGTILGANGCESFVRLEVTVSVIECEFPLIIPDGFSPNGDGINDDFEIVNLEILFPNFKLSIYNRYGNILYEGNIGSQRWNGKSKNKDKVLPVGVYFYILEFNDGENESIQGRVYLSR